MTQPLGFKKLLSLNTLLLFGAIAVALRLSDGDDVAIFAASALAIVPLAGLIGQATEEIAARVGPKVAWVKNRAASASLVGMSDTRSIPSRKRPCAPAHGLETSRATPRRVRIEGTRRIDTAAIPKQDVRL